MNLDKWVVGIFILSIIDILYTGIGAFYGGGGAELNPLLSWLTNPVQFVSAVIILKCIGIAIILGIFIWIESREKPTDLIRCCHLVKGTVAIYGVAMLGIVAANIWWFFH